MTPRRRRSELNLGMQALPGMPVNTLTEDELVPRRVRQAALRAYDHARACGEGSWARWPGPQTLVGPHPTIRNKLRESLAVQCQQTAPCLLGERLAVDARIRRAPAVHGCVYFDLRG